MCAPTDWYGKHGLKNHDATTPTIESVGVGFPNPSGRGNQAPTMDAAP